MDRWKVTTRVGRSGLERRYRRRSGRAGTGRQAEGDAYPARRLQPWRCSAGAVTRVPSPACHRVAQRGPGRAERPVRPSVVPSGDTTEAAACRVPSGGTTDAWLGGATRPCDGCAAGGHNGGLVGRSGPFGRRLCRRVARRRAPRAVGWHNGRLVGRSDPSLRRSCRRAARREVRPLARSPRHRFGRRLCRRVARRRPARRPSPAGQPPVLRHLRRSRSAARPAAATRPRPDQSPRSA
jgi:hypothetical protein